MKIFYDTENNIIGSIVGATENIEAQMEMPGLQGVTVSQDIQDRLNDPQNSLSISNLTIVDGELVEPNIPDPEQT
jgi:hypothetical protein